MLVIFNWIGVGLGGLIIAAMAATLACTQNKHVLVAVIFVASLVSAGIDLFIRLRSQGQGARIIHPKAGGHLFFIPSWLIGLVFAGFMLAVYVNGLR